jgi:hypothetical protein
MSKVLSFLLFVLLIGGLLSVIPEFQKSNIFSQSIKSKKQNFAVYNEWTIKQIDSLSASTNNEFAVN